jgi:RNA polymerase sigma factor (sigma-70 family)
MTQPGSPTPVLRYLRAALGPDADGPSDAELLGRFVTDRDQGAFELLVWRHAGTVLRVGRGVLRDHHAAEDVAQAAFLVLARKAGTIGRRQAVAAWLYRVAYRLALRVAARRRLPVTTADLDRLPAGPPEAAPDPEAVRLLLDELARLPEKYRAPVLLCFFDGLSQADAARRLGWPVGTVAGRIARAKDRLHRRLSRRGVAVPAAGLAVIAAEQAFVATTAKAAAAFAAGQGVVPGVSITVLELAKGAIRTMTATKLQWAAGVLAACGALTVGGVWAAGQVPGAGSSGQPSAGLGAAPVQPPAGGPAAEKAEPAERTADAAQRRRSLNNLKQILIAIHNYHDTYNRLPSDIRDKNGKPILSWRVAILPFVEQDNFYKQFKLDEPWDSEHNLKLLAQMPPVYRVGFEPKGATHTYYQVFAGPGTPFGWSRFDQPGGGEGGAGGGAAPGGAPGIGPGGGPLGGAGAPPGIGAGGVPGGPPAAAGAGGAAPAPQEARGPIRITQITDGTSNTLGVVEAGPPVPWTKPADLPYDPKKPLPKLVGPFSNVFHVSMMDGTANALKRDIDPRVLRDLIGMDDGNVTPDLKTLQARFPAESAEEKQQLADLIAANDRLIDEIDSVLKVHVELLRAANGFARDFDRAEEHADELKRMLDTLKAKNKKLRDDLGLRRDAPVPKPKK